MTCMVCWTSCFFHGSPCLLERKTDSRIWWILYWWWTQSACHVTEDNWQDYFNDKIWAFKWKWQFWKTCVCHCEVGSFSALKGFSSEICDGLNKCGFWYPVMKGTHIWKVCMIQGATIFTMTSVWCLSFLGLPSKCHKFVLWFKQQQFILLQHRGWKSKIQVSAGWFLLRAGRKNLCRASLPASGGLPTIVGIPRLVGTSPSSVSSSSRAISLSVSVSKFPFLK